MRGTGERGEGGAGAVAQWVEFLLGKLEDWNSHPQSLPKCPVGISVHL